MVLNLIVTAVCLWKAVAGESGVFEMPAAPGGPPSSYLVQRAQTPDPNALESPTLQCTGWPQFADAKSRLVARRQHRVQYPQAPASTLSGWQSEVAVMVKGSRERKLLYPYHTFF